jgi:hypothetical protein
MLVNFSRHRRAPWVKRAGWDSRSGGGGIRTHEGLHPAGFQDRCLQPLGHPSVERTLADLTRTRTSVGPSATFGGDARITRLQRAAVADRSRDGTGAHAVQLRPGSRLYAERDDRHVEAAPAGGGLRSLRASRRVAACAGRGGRHPDDAPRTRDGLLAVTGLEHVDERKLDVAKRRTRGRFSGEVALSAKFGVRRVSRPREGRPREWLGGVPTPVSAAATRATR